MVSGAIVLLLSSQVRKTSFAYFPHPLLRKRSKATFYNLAPNIVSPRKYQLFSFGKELQSQLPRVYSQRLPTLRFLFDKTFRQRVKKPHKTCFSFFCTSILSLIFRGKFQILPIGKDNKSFFLRPLFIARLAFLSVLQKV